MRDKRLGGEPAQDVVADTGTDRDGRSQPCQVDGGVGRPAADVKDELIDGNKLTRAGQSGDGRGDLRMTGLGFGSNAPVVVTASAAGSSAAVAVGEITANDRGAFILNGQLPAAVVAACATQGSCVFEGTPGIVLVTAATRDGMTKTTAAYQVKG